MLMTIVYIWNSRNIRAAMQLRQWSQTNEEKRRRKTLPGDMKSKHSSLIALVLFGTLPECKQLEVIKGQVS